MRVKRERKFNTVYDRERDELEKNAGKLITESSGYIPVKTRIQQFLEAGGALISQRQQQFDYEDAFDEDGNLKGDDGVSVDEFRNGEVLDFLEASTKATERVKKASSKKTTKKQKEADSEKPTAPTEDFKLTPEKPEDLKV